MLLLYRYCYISLLPLLLLLLIFKLNLTAFWLLFTIAAVAVADSGKIRKIKCLLCRWMLCLYLSYPIYYMLYMCT